MDADKIYGQLLNHSAHKDDAINFTIYGLVRAINNLEERISLLETMVGEMRRNG